MSSQKIKIDIGTSYNGQGISQANNDLDNLSRNADKVSRNVGKLSSSMSKMSGIIGLLPAPLQTAINSIQGLSMALSVCTKSIFGWIGVAVGIVALLFKLKSGYEETKKKAVEFAKAQRLKDAEARVEQARKELQLAKDLENQKKKAYQEQLKYLEKIAKANLEVYDAEKKRQNSKNDITLAKMKAQTQELANNETDVDKRNLILAQGEQKQTKFEGQVAIKNARLVVREEEAKLRNLQNKIGTTDSKETVLLLKAIEAQLKKVETAKNNVEIIQINSNQANLDSQKKVEEMGQIIADKIVQAEKDAIEAKQKKENEETIEREREQIQKDLDKKLIEKDDNKNLLYKIDNEIKKTNTILNDIENNQKTINHGIAINNAPTGNGINGGNRYGPYTYHPDAQGNLNPGEVARARRHGEGEERDNKTKEMGTDIKGRFDERLKELNRAKRRGKIKEGSREDKELNNLKAWKDQVNGKNAKDARDKLERLQAQRQKVIDKIEEAVKDIKSKMEKLGLK